MTGSEPSLEERLRSALDVPLEAIPYGVDMSSQAITARLRDACEMSTLSLRLGPSLVERDPIT